MNKFLHKWEKELCNPEQLDCKSLLDKYLKKPEKYGFWHENCIIYIME